MSGMASKRARKIALKRREKAKTGRLKRSGGVEQSTYADRQKKKAFGSQEPPSPFALHPSAIRNDSDAIINTFKTFQGPPIRRIDTRNTQMRENKYLVTMPGLAREVQLIDETEMVKSQLKKQTVASKGSPFWERKDRPVEGNGGTRLIPPHVARIKVPSAVIKKMIKQNYKPSRYAFAPNTAVLVKRFEDIPIGAPIGNNNWVGGGKPLGAKEMLSGDMQKHISHYYRNGSLYIRKTDLLADGNRMLKLRIMARKRAAKEEKLAVEEQQRQKRLAKRALKMKSKGSRRPRTSHGHRRPSSNSSLQSGAGALNYVAQVERPKTAPTGMAAGRTSGKLVTSPLKIENRQKRPSTSDGSRRRRSRQNQSLSKRGSRGDSARRSRPPTR